MKGLEISRLFFEEYGFPMLKRDFPDILDLIAVGFTGSGSERYGYDDDISRDHDFEAGFYIFLPSEEKLDRRKEFLLERAYSTLPKEFMGIKRGLLSPVGGNRVGPVRTEEYFTEKAGSPDGILTVDAWLHTPDYALCEAVNGEIFYDGSGEVTRIRERLNSMPKDVLKKRLAGNLLIMAQAGQYNCNRCISHGEAEAAILAKTEFVNAAIKVMFLLKSKYAPYYKWSFRALRDLYGESAEVALLGKILTENNENTVNDIEVFSKFIINELIALGISSAVGDELERHAYSVNNEIEDSNIRNLHILTAV